MKTVSILGSTGSVGQSTVDLIAAQPDKFSVALLSCNSNVKKLAEQALLLKAKKVVVAQDKYFQELKDLLAATDIDVAAGQDALIEAAAQKVDWVMAAIVGMAGLVPIMKAVEQGGIVAIANKEPLVSAGPFILEAARKAGTVLLPVDSEHNAVFQVFDKDNIKSIERIILTASGGPFRDWTAAEMAVVTPEQAVAHPNWSMGAKISVDSATMMNKALEIIEAHYLFDMPAEKIDVLVHPQSIIHSMVEYNDGSVLAQMGAPDMRTPIAHALAWPARMDTTGQKLDFSKALQLDLRPVDTERFRSVSLAYDCLAEGLAYSNAFNAANEIAVAAFLDKKIGFLDIVQTVEAVLEKIDKKTFSTLDDVIDFDTLVRQRTTHYINTSTEIRHII